MSYSKIVAAASLIAALGASSAALAEYPEKRIEIIVPFAAGGTSDMMARLIADELSERWQQTVIVTNRTGASGGVGALAAATASPDGYTLLVISNSVTQSPFLMDTFPIDPAEQLQPVVKLLSQPLIFAVNPSINVSNLQELISYAKENPDTFNVAVAGSSTRTATGLFELRAGLDKLSSIPYSGSAPANAAVVSNEAQMYVTDPASASALFQAGTLVALAVTTEDRSTFLPDIPSAAESGLEDFDVSSWQALFAPAGTPDEIVEKLNAEINRIMLTPEWQERVQQLASTSEPNSVQQFTESFHAELDSWEAVIAEAGISLE